MDDMWFKSLHHQDNYRETEMFIQAFIGVLPRSSMI